MSTFLERIKVLCKQKGVTVKQAEIDNGLGTGYFRTTSKQGSIPRSDRLDRIAEYFNVSREYLLGETETQKEQPSLGVRIPLYDRVAAGLPDAYIMERGGWSTTYTMTNVYRHTLTEDRRKQQEKVNDVFTGLL